MKNKRKIITIGSVITLTIIGTIIGIRRSRSNKIYKKLIEALQQEENVEGTIDDLLLTAFNPAYYKTVGSLNLPSDRDASAMAKAIEGSLHRWPKADDIDTIKTQMTLAGSKAGVSKIASVYKSIFKNDMIDDLKTHLDSGELEQIDSVLKNLNDYY
jgi:hypothetical protein